MDLGRFERSRLQFWLWITVPLLLMVLTTVPSMVYLHLVRRDLQARQDLLAQVPAAEKRLRSAQDVLRAVTPVSTQLTEATEEATRRLDRAAKGAGLTIRSLKVAQGVEEEEGFTTANISVQLQGPLPAVVRWLDDVRKPGLLLSVREATLNSLGPSPDEEFSGDITVRLRLRKTG